MTAQALVDLDAVAANVAALARLVAPSEVCAVVKADAYGHGAVPVARAAVAAGAGWLAVAQVGEGEALRAAGVDAPVLVLSEPAADEMRRVVAAALTPAVYTRAGIAAANAAACAAGARLGVHLKVDTGMRRVGAEPVDAPGLAALVADLPALDLDGVWTHCAVADEPEHEFTATQLARFDAVLARLAADGHQPRIRHAANSAVALAHPAGRYDLVRCGIAVYGVAPAPALADLLALRPALSLCSTVTFTKRVPAGEGISYGLRHTTAHDTVIATVGIGYADGVRRALGATGGEVLVRGRRLPIAGTVTMDQLMVDCGPDTDIEVGDEVVLLGSSGDETISADEWAARLDTISYEVLCGIGPRVERRWQGG
ncbi:MAG TPA: alanine racemase [Acidimicrobiales bacterium]|nr:alanine racemase [Acidimicrobiales bacterium]